MVNSGGNTHEASAGTGAHLPSRNPLPAQSFGYTCTNRVVVTDGTDCPYTQGGEVYRCSTNGGIFLTVVQGGMMVIRPLDPNGYAEIEKLFGGTAGGRSVLIDDANQCSNYNKCPVGDVVTGSIAYTYNDVVPYTGAGAYVDCDPGSVIKSITGARYGCPSRAQSNVLETVTGLCVGQPSCVVAAWPPTFGSWADDPCPGTVKTLEITWTCG